MRSNALNHFMYFIYKQFKIIWLAISIIALVLVMYFNFKLSYKHGYQEVLASVKDLSKQFDGFIEDLRQEIYALPFYRKNIHHCTKELDESLNRIVLNRPQVSGLIITDEESHELCSTLESPSLNAKLKGPSNTLLGPFNLNRFEQPVYLLRQKISSYYINIILVASVLENELETSHNLSSTVVLYDNLTKNELIKIQYNNAQNSWINSSELNQIDSSSVDFIKDKLQSIDGISIGAFANNKTILRNLWLSETLVFFATLAICYLLYNLIAHNINRHYSLKRAIKLALKNEQFFPVYQPVFAQRNHKISGVEILLRWADQEGNIIMPDSFIKEAESSGLIVPITLQIIKTSFKEFRSVLKQMPTLHFAINLCVSHFKSPDFFEHFEQLRAQYKITTQQIMFEITERDLLDRNDEIFLNQMNELRTKGYSLAIDDYGTGHASIAYLQSFPFNYLKIDKLFIQAIGTKAITESLNDAIIQMAKNLNLVIIAEGVETQEQVDYLTKNEVAYLQGWFFSKAVSIEKIIDIIQGIHNEQTN